MLLCTCNVVKSIRQAELNCDATSEMGTRRDDASRPGVQWDGLPRSGAAQSGAAGERSQSGGTCVPSIPECTVYMELAEDWVTKGKKSPCSPSTSYKLISNSELPTLQKTSTPIAIEVAHTILKFAPLDLPEQLWNFLHHQPSKHYGLPGLTKRILELYERPAALQDGLNLCSGWRFR